MIKIICAAIYFDDGRTYPHPPKNISTGFVVCGHRHGNCFSIAALIPKKEGLRGVQGFLTSDGNFVNRKEAGKIAYEAGQIKKLTELLYSEDLY